MMKRSYFLFFLLNIFSLWAMEDREQPDGFKTGFAQLPIEMKVQVLKRYLNAQINQIQKNKTEENSFNSIIKTIGTADEYAFILSEQTRKEYLKKLVRAAFLKTGRDINIDDAMLARLIQSEQAELREFKNDLSNFGFSIADLQKEGSPELQKKFAITADNVLDLSDLRINNLQGLQNISGIKTLRSLKLNNNRLTHIAADAFHGFDQLKNLELNNNQLPAIPVHALKKLPNLVFVFLNGNNDVEQQKRMKEIAALRRALPKINIIQYKPNKPKN